MGTKFRHLGKVLSPLQVGALLFALSEGEVGSGANVSVVYGRVRYVGKPTLRYLQGAGLLTVRDRVDGTMELTTWGREVAARIRDVVYPLVQEGGGK
jgi:hypothetical protein